MASLDLSLHRAQMKVFRSAAQVKVVVAGRGFGKSVLLLFTGIYFCLTYKEPIKPESPQIALIAFPTLKMGRAIAWQPLLNLLEKLPIVKRIDKSNFRIVFQGQRPDLVLRGADRQGDRLRGLNVAFAGLDEYQDFHPDTWDKVLEPALTRNKNWKALVIGTPKGKATHFFKFHEKAIAYEDWKYFHFTTFDNPFISRKSLHKAEQDLPPKVFRQEYQAGWEDFDGQLFPQLAQHHKAEAVPTSYKSVYLGMDWGDLNPSMVVVGATHQGDYYMINSWRNTSGLPVTEDEIKAKAKAFCQKYNVYRCYLPDDRPASILSFRRYGKQHQCPGMQRSVRVVRSKPGPMERALIGNTLFHNDRLWFGPECHGLHAEFESYHRGTDAQGNLLNEPAKKQEDHSIDACLHVIGQLEGKYINESRAAA